MRGTNPCPHGTTKSGAPVARLTRVQWLTPSDVAARLQVCRATVYKLCDAGELAVSAAPTPSGCVATCEANGAKPIYYLADVLIRVQTHGFEDR